MRKPVYRVSDSKLPGSFQMVGLNYVQIILIDSIEDRGKMVVLAGKMKSKPFLSIPAAEREFDRLSSLSVVGRANLEGYSE